MIVAVACVPQAPLLLPGVTGGHIPEVEEIRLAAAAAVEECLAVGVEESVVVGAAPTTRHYPPQSPPPTAAFAPAPGRDAAAVTGALPYALAVGQSFLPQGRVILAGIEQHASPETCVRLGHDLAAGAVRRLLVVAGDAGGRRTQKAPGYIDHRTFDHDERIAQALATADTAALLGLDPGLCADLLVSGRAAWQVMAGACQEGVWQARVLFHQDPFGVDYHIVTWRRAEPGTAGEHQN